MAYIFIDSSESHTIFCKVSFCTNNDWRVTDANSVYTDLSSAQLRCFSYFLLKNVWQISPGKLICNFPGVDRIHYCSLFTSWRHWWTLQIKHPSTKCTNRSNNQNTLQLLLRHLNKNYFRQSQKNTLNHLKMWIGPLVNWKSLRGGGGVKINVKCEGSVCVCLCVCVSECSIIYPEGWTMHLIGSVTFS